MSNNELIEEIINNDNYKIFEDGRVLTRFNRAGRISEPEQWRPCISRQKNGELTVFYKNKKLQLKRIIYRKFKGVFQDSLVIVNLDRNLENNHYSNLEQVVYKNFFKPIEKNHPNYILHMDSKKKERVQRIENELQKDNLLWLNKEDYKGTEDSVCDVKCPKDHFFTIHNKTVLRGNVFCPICSENFFLGETISKIILELLLGFKLAKTKQIVGLIDPNTGYQLEIDGFNLEHKIGFEYQGLQHYRFSKFIHKNKSNFDNLQAKDKIKQDFFANKGWKLLQISQFENIDVEIMIENIKEMLLHDAPHLTIKNIKNQDLKESVRKVLFGENASKDLTELLSHFDYYNKAMDYIHKNQAELVSGTFKSKDSIVVIKNKQGKLWKVRVDYLLRSIDSNSVNLINKGNLKEEKSKEIMDIAKGYDSFTDFNKEKPRLSEWIRRNGYTDQLRNIFGLEKSKAKGIQHYTDEYLINEAKKFTTRGQMYHEGRNAYELILLRKLQTLAFAHMVKPSRKKA